ncbi:hypothetical protein HYH03_012257 [Edaphochlamys debaryana]|uniref:Peptidase M11 gametolysin domain-containing protein n=1 Tax=Edaphochlamys debaryana TaxID=47281 RepID=A0A836BUB4_9CHLO|nr:hypothetical protein HYH03_012257 [Edaphochlamys debaryana]|eukprot:KAG2489235.1 hypothetical protein HYH03_012257 [Edaphochlamys debaryana]
MALAAPSRCSLAAAVLIAALVVSSAQAPEPDNSGEPLAPAPPFEPETLTVTSSLYYGSAFRWVTNPPPKRRPPPAGSRAKPPPAGVSDEEWAGIEHAPSQAELRIGCPRDDSKPGIEYLPGCNSPTATIAVGDQATQLRDAYGFNNGDTATLKLRETAAGVARRRALHEGRALSGEEAGAVPTAPSFELLDLQVTQEKEQKEIYVGNPIDLRTIVFILDFSQGSTSSCGPASSWGPAVKTEDVRAAMRDQARFPNNLNNFYTTCSYGKSFFRDENTYVLGPVPIPCRGFVMKNFTGRPVLPPRPPPKPPSQWANLLPLSRRNDTVDDWWDVSRFCTASEQQAWEREAEKFARLRAATDPKLAAILSYRERRRNIYILPNGLTCQWAGYADVTCTSPTCSVYVKGGVAGLGLQVLAHEAMHNYGLEHAGMGMDEYGDATDVMGNFRQAGSGVLCPNAPNMYRIGWAKPLNPPGTRPNSLTAAGGQYGSLSAGNFTRTANKRQFYLPAFGSRDDNHLMIALGARFAPATAWDANRINFYSDAVRNPKIPYPVYYISYRVRNSTAGGFDSGLTSSQHMKVLIHQYNGTQSERTFGFKSLLMDWGPSFNRKAAWDASGRTWAGRFVQPQRVRDPQTGGFLEVGGGLVVRVVGSPTAAGATVEVCQQYALSEDCGAGVDADCDGLVGDDDPDCA